MIYLLRIPKINDYRLTKEECKNFGIDWVEGETNFELVLISCQPEDLSTTIEDSLGVISAKRVEGNTWEIKGYDELRSNLDVVFNEYGVIHILVEQLDYTALERFCSKPSVAMRMCQYCF